MKPIVIDFETKKSFREAPDPRNLGISVAGVYDYATDQYQALEEAELPILFSLMEKASVIIGFNIDSFDLPVLEAYYPGQMKQFRTFDLLTDVKNLTGRRYSLDNLVQATLGKGKSGHGLQAIQLFRQGKMDELKSYCLDDVRLTKELLEFGMENGWVSYTGNTSIQKLYVRWSGRMSMQAGSVGNDISLTLPF